MLSNVGIERFVFEIFTNEICKDLFFLNKKLVLENIDDNNTGWLKNLHYEQCKRHSDCIREKLKEQVFKCCFEINKYFPKEMNELFRNFYLCHKPIPQEPFIDYCIRFFEFYKRNKLDSKELFYVNDIMMYCFNKLSVNKKRFPDFFSVKPLNWEKYVVVIPPYVAFQKFDCDIDEAIHNIKNKKMPERCENIYLFSGLGSRLNIRKINQSVIDFFLLCHHSLTIENILLRLKKQFSNNEYESFLQVELPILFDNKEVLITKHVDEE